MPLRMSAWRCQPGGLFGWAALGTSGLRSFGIRGDNTHGIKLPHEEAQPTVPAPQAPPPLSTEEQVRRYARQTNQARLAAHRAVAQARRAPLRGRADSREAGRAEASSAGPRPRRRRVRQRQWLRRRPVCLSCRSTCSSAARRQDSPSEA